MSISITSNDTHAAVKNLEAKGASKELAEEIVATVRATKVESDPATKVDVQQLRGDMYPALMIHGFVTVTAVIGAAAALGSVLSGLS